MKIDEETNLLRLFKYWVGDTSCPEKYLDWAFVSMVAAAMGKRVWIATKPGGSDRMVPNLYTLMLGGQNSGKSYAIHRTLELFRKTEHENFLNLFEGKITAPALYSAMTPQHKYPYRNQVYVVNDEMANCVGLKEYADQYLTSMVQMYYGAPFTDITRSSGDAKLKDYSINWIAATTPEYFYSVCKEHHVEGGLFSRICIVNAEATGRRVFRVSPPTDLGAVESRLISRINEIFHNVAGEFTRTPEAEAFEEEWYMKAKGNTVERQHDIVLKIALVLSVSDSTDMKVKLAHVEKAVEMVEDVNAAVEVARDIVVRKGKPKIAMLDDIRMTICATCKKNGCCQRGVLMHYAARKYGINVDEFDRIIRTLKGEGSIEESNEPRSVPGGGTNYHWVSKIES